jgi:hypothetical protein
MACRLAWQGTAGRAGQPGGLGSTSNRRRLQRALGGAASGPAGQRASGPAHQPASVLAFQYRLALVDLDLKPLVKLPAHYMLDSKVVACARAHEAASL